ncbi:MAG: MFS transporter [Saprospiraceae bacterium]|nr:MFS transporter [Saprospiraceae bacterium]MBK7435882.1 MFS transporter [Saprospiraceae bacterium]MBK8281693.1 MFS transporter [Saprospiraceae bacterium]MBK8514015.1 MFS transporter [Saprospiraceae bacterium]MBK9929636.1 MFS transporter [Saprospiraceae bacterium]
MQTTFVKNDAKVIKSWAMFDWANSSYSLVISSAIFPTYFLSVTNATIHVGNTDMPNSSYFSFIISLAYVFVAIGLPILSGIADYSGKRLYFLRLFTIIGSLACISMYFFRDMNTLWIGTAGFMLASIGFTSSLVFYNSYLPVIATEDKYDKTSARGFAYGYVGSVILLIVNLFVIEKKEWFGITETSVAVRLAFVMVGLWWFFFAQIPFRKLPADTVGKFGKAIWRKGYQELRSVWRRLQHQPHLKRFLMAFFFYSAGVQTVLYMAATFADKELHFGGSELIIIILILQLVGLVGANFFALVSRWKGNKFSLLVMLTLWITVCVFAYYTYTKTQFYLIASGVGLVMGGIQALSRSTYGKLLDEDELDITSYYSFYDVLEKIAIVVGTFSFGYIDLISGGMRNSVLILIVFFAIGIAILSTVNMDMAERDTR